MSKKQQALEGGGGVRHRIHVLFNRDSLLLLRLLFCHIYLEMGKDLKQQSPPPLLRVFWEKNTMSLLLFILFEKGLLFIIKRTILKAKYLAFQEATLFIRTLGSRYTENIVCIYKQPYGTQ